MRKYAPIKFFHSYTINLLAADGNCATFPLCTHEADLPQGAALPPGVAAAPPRREERRLVADDAAFIALAPTAHELRVSVLPATLRAPLHADASELDTRVPPEGAWHPVPFGVLGSDATSEAQDASSLSVWAASLRGPQPPIHGGNVWPTWWYPNLYGCAERMTLSQLLRRLSRQSRERVSLRPLSALLRVPPARAREARADGTLHLLPFDLDTTPPPAGAWAPRPAWPIIDRDETLPAQDAVWARRAARYTPYTLHPTPYTLHLTPYTLHPTPYTLTPDPYTLHPRPWTLNPKP